MFTKSIFTAAIVLLSSTTLATASPAAHQKRSGPGLHLTNCYVGSNGYQSEMVYYTNDATQAGQDVALVGSSNTFTKWEGQPVSGYFGDSGVTFTSNIEADAQSQSTGTKVGTGYNGHNWYCYKDNNHFLYGNGSENCYSVYYCLLA